jgi:lipopolysaccharide export LptBFGC system permease protein LptF
MSQKLLHNLVWIPIAIIGLTAVLLSPGWMFSSEPWMLDKTANEALLDLSYDELFSQDVNRNLPDYLTLMYRFFGLWVFAVGSLILAFVLITKMGTSLARNTILPILGVVLIAVYCIEFRFIPSSHFVYLSHFHMLCFLISAVASVKLNRSDL